MILPDYDLRRWAQSGGLTPYDDECINPASVDLRWSGNVKVATGWTLEHTPIWCDMTEHVRPDGFYLLPNLFYLLDSLEVINMPNNQAGIMFLKSTPARLGLESSHAGFFDPRFNDATGTFEISVVSPWPILLKPGQRIVQLALMKTFGIPGKTYADTGRYNGQRGPTEAR